MCLVLPTFELWSVPCSTCQCITSVITYLILSMSSTPYLLSYREWLWEQRMLISILAMSKWNHANHWHQWINLRWRKQLLRPQSLQRLLLRRLVPCMPWSMSAMLWRGKTCSMLPLVPTSTLQPIITTLSQPLTPALLAWSLKVTWIMRWTLTRAHTSLAPLLRTTWPIILLSSCLARGHAEVASPRKTAPNTAKWRAAPLPDNSEIEPNSVPSWSPLPGFTDHDSPATLAPLNPKTPMPKKKMDSEKYICEQLARLQLNQTHPPLRQTHAPFNGFKVIWTWRILMCN